MLRFNRCFKYSITFIIQNIFLLGNAASSEIKLNKRNGIEYVDSRSNYGQSDGYRLSLPTERLFNVPLRATPEAAGSPQCVTCRARGRECLIVRHTNHVTMFPLYSYSSFMTWSFLIVLMTCYFCRLVSST